MIALFQHNGALMAVCALIGVITAWWMFSRHRRKGPKP